MAKTPSASTIMDGIGSGIGSPAGMLKQAQSVAAFNAMNGQQIIGNDPSIIQRNRVSNAVKHEIFLKDE